MILGSGLSISPGVTISFEDINLLNDYGTLWTFGSGREGQLGTGNLNNTNYPVQVGTSNIWKQISVGFTFCVAIKNDGTLWSWGNNAHGQLGLGDTTQRNTPAQVGTATNWKQVACADSHVIAIKNDGTLWSWGYNFFLGLGLGNKSFIYFSTNPTQVGTATDWKYIASAQKSSAAIKNDGTLWTWGTESRTLGLGENPTVDFSLPNQVGNSTNWQKIYGSPQSLHMAGIHSDGSLWVWGINSEGELGLGDNDDRFSPTESIIQNCTEASVGYSGSAFIKSDGTLWTCGSNNFGGLGLGDNTQRNTITQVGTSTNWKHVSCGGYYMLAIKNDNTLWAWGYNFSGALGLGNYNYPNIPTQVGNSNKWIQVCAGADYSTAAIQS
jgi:alpha-tubulin suppressor-like RCC1 family protein